MMRARKHRSRSARYPRHWPYVAGWSLGLLVSVWLLVGLAYAIGRAAPTRPTAVPEAVLAAASSPGTAITTAFAAGLLGAWCLRHVCLHWQAWKPGGIEVAEFRAATKLSDADVAQLTLEFRRLLGTLRLQAPAPVPGAAPEGDFLDVLGRNGVDTRNVLGTLVSLLRAATPARAYQIQGVLRERAEHPRYGVIVQVVRVPGETWLPIAVWGETWDVALRNAADEATALVLPCTRRCRAPWGAWRGYAMPRGLLHAYEEATQLEQDRRYDEALHQYYEAVELDPMNMVLRLRIGQLQERLGLFLDALATYCGMLAASRPAGTRLPLRLYRGRGRRERRRALTSARYRRNVLLGGRVLAEQWAEVGNRTAPTRRDEQRERLRCGLRRHLAPMLVTFLTRAERRRAWHDVVRGRRPATPLWAVDRDGAVTRRVRDALAVPTGDAEHLCLRELLAAYAIHDSRRLRVRLMLRRFDRRTTLTPCTVALTVLCIRVRLAWVARRRGGGGAWPPDDVHRSIRRIELGARRLLPPPLRRASFRHWHEHYNAACALALPLLCSALPQDRRDVLADAAVRRLERATARADSAYIASRRDWLVSEDPDLKGLRTTDQFKNFELMYLPASEVTPRRPRGVQKLESSRYVRALLVATAESWQRTWQRRGRRLANPPGIDEALKWFGDEQRMWERVREVVVQYRHSGTRFALIEEMRRCADDYGCAPLTVAFPRYEACSLPETDGSCDVAAAAELALADATLAAVAARLCRQGPVGPAKTLLDDLGHWRATLYEAEATAREPWRWLLAALCDHHAALWQLLARWIEADAGAARQAEDAFAAKAAATRALWRVALKRWALLSRMVARSPGDDARVPLGLLVRYQLESWSRAARTPSPDGVRE